MKLNWFSTNLLVSATLCGLIASTGAANAFTVKPVRCEVCCPPGGCNYQQYYDYMQTTQTSTTNTGYQGQLPSATQLRATAGWITAWVAETTKNGGMAQAQALFIQAVENGDFYNETPSTQKVYTTMVAFGGIVPQSQLITWQKNVTLAIKQKAVALIQNEGLGAVLTQTAAYLDQAADKEDFRKVWESQHPGSKLPYLVNPDITTYCDIALGIGYILSLGTGVGEAIGIGLTIGALAITVVNDMGGYGD